MRNIILIRVVIIKVAQEILKCISDLPVCVGEACQYLVRQSDIFAIVAGGYPQPQYVGPVLLHDLLGRYDIAERLRHLLSQAVYDKAVRQAIFIRHDIINSHTGDERGLEPSPVLVGPFKI